VNRDKGCSPARLRCGGMVGIECNGLEAMGPRELLPSEAHRVLAWLG
jgi:hypothetical protein